MQYLSFGVTRRHSDPKYDKALDALSEKYAESKIQEPSAESALLSPEARKKKLKQEFKKSVQMDEHEKYLSDAVSILINDGERHLKNEEWDILLKELRKAKRKLSKIEYNANIPEILYPALGFTNAGMRAIDTVARLKYRLKEYENAIALHTLLATLNAADPVYWYHLGICFQDTELYDKAVKAYSFCHILDPENIATYIFSAECFLELENKKAARLEYEEAIELVDRLDDKSLWQKHLDYIKEKIENY